MIKNEWIVVLSISSIIVDVHRTIEAQSILNKGLKDLNHPRYQQVPNSPKKKFKKGSKR